MRYITVVGDKQYTIDIEREGEVVVDGAVEQLDMRQIGQEGLHSLLLNDLSYEALVDEGEGAYHVLIDGTLYHVTVIDERAKRLADAAGTFGPGGGEVFIKSPMPGLIVAVPVSSGDAVAKGQVVVVLESMKMENELKSPRDGRITAVKVEPRQAVEQNQVMIVIGD
jgi:biotin carboxyl carrier protein